MSFPPIIDGPVRVRFAPSPTGYLHVGGARTALYNYLFAKHYKGKFILRIEDTDLERSTEESLKMVIQDLIWMGLNWDEGPHPLTLKDQGEFGPYKQSMRLGIYQEQAKKLLNEGKAYYCFLSDQELEEQREHSELQGGFSHIQSPYVDMPLNEALKKIDAGEKPVVRFKTKNLKNEFSFKDLVRGEIKLPTDMIGDFVLLRSDGMPVYNFCCVVDDYLMKISHVLRAEEHLSNTLRQLMIYEALGWKIPQFGHISLVLDEDKQKMSKRKGATSCHQFKEAGYLPEALRNFILLLGWSHPQEKEIFSFEEMMDCFTTERLQPSGAVFDPVKLKWMNAQYLRSLPADQLWNLIEPRLQNEKIQFFESKEWQIQSVEVFKSHMELLTDATALYRQLDDQYYTLSEEAHEALHWETTKSVLNAWTEELSKINKTYLSESDFNLAQDGVKNRAGVKGKNLFMPIRVAVIGKPHGTDLKLLVPLIPKTSLIKRAQIALDFLKGVDHATSRL